MSGNSIADKGKYYLTDHIELSISEQLHKQVKATTKDQENGERFPTSRKTRPPSSRDMDRQVGKPPEILGQEADPEPRGCLLHSGQPAPGSPKLWRDRTGWDRRHPGLSFQVSRAMWASGLGTLEGAGSEGCSPRAQPGSQTCHGVRQQAENQPSAGTRSEPH